jgi:hypothetical protein
VGLLEQNNAISLPELKLNYVYQVNLKYV